jgi:DNA-binding GntR family transcriptional regulator
LRDALIRLREERLIDLPPRHGFRVLPISPLEMRETYEVLAGLESTAIELLISKGLSASEMGELTAAAGALEDALQDDNLDGWPNADAEFHSTLFRLAGNGTLIAAFGQFREKIGRVRLLTLKLRPKPEQSTRSHCELAKAIINRDAANAREIHWRQRLRSSAELTHILESLNLHHL